jgi:hypothetical protein
MSPDKPGALAAAFGGAGSGRRSSGPGGSKASRGLFSRDDGAVLVDYEVLLLRASAVLAVTLRRPDLSVVLATVADGEGVAALAAAKARIAELERLLEANLGISLFHGGALAGYMRRALDSMLRVATELTLRQVCVALLDETSCVHAVSLLPPPRRRSRDAR